MKKCYVWVNTYCRGVQTGIQAFHAGIELSQTIEGVNEFVPWANDEKTVVFLNGGDHAGILGIVAKLEQLGIKHADDGLFREEGLNYAATALAFVPEQDVFDIQDALKEHSKRRRVDPTYEVKGYEMVAELVKRYGNDKVELAQYIMEFPTHGG